ncbi:MAG TPA: TonB family protein [Stellaceae bacterium]|jgi:protein TonB|nr:TonB family protein [Stellaceae bacterium]
MLSASGDEIAVFPHRDRHLALSAGASLLLHGAALALLLSAWHAAPQVEAEIKAIPVTLIAVGTDATNANASSARADETIPAPTQAMSAPPPPVAAPPVEPAPPPRPTKPKPAKPAPLAMRPAPAPIAPAPSAPVAAAPDLSALLHEGVNGRPLGSDSEAHDQRTLRASAAVGDDYLVRLKARLEPFASIPAAASAKHESGIGVVGFTLARDGTVRRVWIEKTTGYDELDDASMAMVRAASPLPPLPSTIADDSVSFFETVNYPVNLFDKLFR